MQSSLHTRLQLRLAECLQTWLYTCDSQTTGPRLVMSNLSADKMKSKSTAKIDLTQQQKMDRKVLFICLCVTVFSSLISISHGGFCSRIQHHYSYQRYCAYRSWWRGCVRYGYLPISVYDVVMGCCTGFEGSDCTTPICMTPCEPGYMCTSPDDCTVDPTLIGTTNAPINTNTAVNETTSATVEPSSSPSTEPNEIIN